MKRFLLTGISLLLFSFPVFAKDLYVTDSIKTTLRNGPGNDKKLLKMVGSGEKMTLLDAQETWSKVQLSDGSEGWMLNQWLTEEIPRSVQFLTIQKKYDSLLEKYTSLKQSSDAAMEENKTLKEGRADGENTQPGVSSTSTEAPDENLALNLKLKEEVQSLKTSLDEKNRELDALNDKVKWNLIIWFLAGSGVLLLGLLIGLSMRQKRHYSLLD